MSDETWLSVRRGDAPLLVSIPHTGLLIAPEDSEGLVSRTLARQDADWWIDRLYDFAASLGATIVHTAVSRTVIDVNRDPSGASLYPGQATTELCPTTTFDGVPLYRPGEAPDAAAIEDRKARFFAPYHAALAGEVRRLRRSHPRIVVYDCHSIRSVIPRLFEGTLPVFNIGTNSGSSCDPALAARVEAVCRATGLDTAMNGRFKGGFITRSLGAPANGVHAIQMELACRGYLHEPSGVVDESNWPTPYDEAFVAPMRRHLAAVLEACLSFVQTP